MVLVIELFKPNMVAEGNLYFINTKLFSYGFLNIDFSRNYFNLYLKTLEDKKIFKYFSWSNGFK